MATFRKNEKDEIEFFDIVPNTPQPCSLAIISHLLRYSEEGKLAPYRVVVTTTPENELVNKQHVNIMFIKEKEGGN
ncbi:hypothetical protein C5Y96_17075 [Blastopirellula marina]|uniref:Uncharacterized protein n=1 Tax=Blastopirellula marina TaxID=124 RepID=A0A2S8F833_9BACT|nr:MULTISPECIES: hypothetical protein [Pirellulaceae]PQO28084.1 hypothetical protein C5Y96_17075 [Blastopirellula marina]RCS48510.1 hypothetical protein DTL36_17100 [Bremerella cremea]